MFNHKAVMISAGSHLTILESVDSTNNYAMAKVRDGLANHGDGYFAKAQLTGRGQRGKTWLTEPGTNIILTVVLQVAGRYNGPPFRLSAAMALAAFDFFSFYAGDETAIKWPNDIYWRDRKAGGILIDAISGSRTGLGSTDGQTAIGPEATGWKWAVTGMGININQTLFPEDLRNAVSLKQITGQTRDVVELAADLQKNILGRYDRMCKGEDPLPEYNNRLFAKDKTMRFRQGNRVFEALVKRVDEDGGLVLASPLDQAYSFGELEWLL